MKSHLPRTPKPPALLNFQIQSIPVAKHRSAFVELFLDNLQVSRFPAADAAGKMLGFLLHQQLDWRIFFQAQGSKYVRMNCKPTFGLPGQRVKSILKAKSSVSDNLETPNQYLILSINLRFKSEQCYRLRNIVWHQLATSTLQVSPGHFSREYKEGLHSCACVGEQTTQSGQL